MAISPDFEEYLKSRQGSFGGDLEPTQPEGPGLLSRAYSGVLDIAGLQKRLVDKYVSEALGLEQPAEGEPMPTLGQRLGRTLFTPEPDDSAIEGVARGITTFATDIATDPLTYELGFLGKGAQGITKLLGGTPAAATKAAQATQAATAGLFVPAMAEAAMTNIPAGIQAAREGRAGEAAEKITEGALAGGAGVLGARHAARSIWGETQGITPERVAQPVAEAVAGEKPQPLDSVAPELDLTAIAAKKKAFRDEALRKQTEEAAAEEAATIAAMPEDLLMVEPEAEALPMVEPLPEPPVVAAPEPVVAPPAPPTPPVQPPAIVEGPQVGERVLRNGVEHTVTSEPYFEPSNGKVMVGAQPHVEGVGEIAIPVEEARPAAVAELPTKPAKTPIIDKPIEPEVITPFGAGTDFYGNSLQDFKSKAASRWGSKDWFKGKPVDPELLAEWKRDISFLEAWQVADKLQREAKSYLSKPIDVERQPTAPPMIEAPPLAKDVLAPEAVAPPEGVESVISRVAETGKRLAKKTREAQEAELFRELPQIDLETLDDAQLQALQSALKPYGSKIAQGIKSEVTNEYLRRGEEGMEMGGGLVPPQIMELSRRFGIKSIELATSLFNKAKTLLESKPDIQPKEFIKGVLTRDLPESRTASPDALLAALEYLYKAPESTRVHPSEIRQPPAPARQPKRTPEVAFERGPSFAEREVPISAREEAFAARQARAGEVQFFDEEGRPLESFEGKPITPERPFPEQRVPRRQEPPVKTEAALPEELVTERVAALEAGEAYPTDITRREKALGIAPKKPKVTVTEAAPLTGKDITPQVVSQVVDRARVLGQGKLNPDVIRNAATELGLDTKSPEGLEALRTGVNSLAQADVLPKAVWKPVEPPAAPKKESKLVYKQLKPVREAIEAGKPEEKVVEAYKKSVAILKKRERLDAAKEERLAAEAGEVLGQERAPTQDILERISKAPGRVWQGQGTKADLALEAALKKLSPGSQDLFRRSIQLYRAGFKPGERLEVGPLMDRLAEEMSMSRDAIKKARQRLKKDVERVAAKPMTVGGSLLPIDPIVNLAKKLLGIGPKVERAITMPEAEAGFRALDVTKGPTKAKPGVKGEPDVVESWINTDNNLIGVSDEGKRAVIQNSQRLQEAGVLDRTNKEIAKALGEQAKLVGLADHNTLIERATENLKNVREAPAYLAALKQRLAEAGEAEASYKLLSEDLNLPIDKREGAMLAGTATNLQMSQLAYVAANNSSAGGRNLALARWMKTPHPNLSRKNTLKEGLKQAGIHPDQIKDIMQAYDDFMGGDTNYESVQALIQKSILHGRDQSIWESAMHLYKHGLLGIPSAIANMSGNVISYGLKTQLESRVAAGLSMAVSAATGKAREYYHPPRELYRGIDSEVNRTVLSRVMKDLSNVLLARPLEQAPGVLDQLYGIADLHRTKNPLPGRLGEFLGNSMYKLLEIGDTATKSKILYHELAKKAWNLTRKADPRGDKATLIKETLRKVDEWTKAFEKGEVSGEVAKIWKEAANNTARAVFQEVGKRGSISRALERGLGAHPMLDLIVPFKRTPINIFLETARRLPILGFTRFNKLRLDLKAGKISPETFYTEMAKPVVGSAVGYLLYEMAKNKVLTGGGPTDPKQEEALRQTGWAPYSLRLPKELAGKEMYVSFQRLEPLSSVIGVAADVAEAERLGKVKDAKSLTEKLISSLGANLINKTFVSGLESLATAWADPKLYLSRFAKQIQGSIIPATIGYVPFAGAARDIDPVFRKTEAFTAEPFKARIPGLSKTLEPQRTATGEERPRREVLGGVRAVSPFEFTEAKTGPEARLNKEFINVGYIPSLIPDTIKIQGRDADLTPQERQTLVQARKAATQAAMRVIQDPTYQRLPNNPDEALYPGQKTKRDVLEKIYARYRQIVMRSLRPSLRQRAWKQPPQEAVEIY